ncbi:MAG TPA: hypothetical protein ENJ84_01025 [Gammaproteobacteria bacterium]|nr:hypothetical protein [Gammaproteobacteria bacterium]
MKSAQLCLYQGSTEIYLPALIQVQFPRCFMAGLFLIHSASLLLVLWLPLVAVVKISLFSVILASFWFYYWRGWSGEGCSAARVLRPQTLTDWQMETGQKKSLSLQLQDFRVFRYLVLLYFKTEAGKSCLIMLCVDQVSRETHRRLRAGLNTVGKL